MFRHDIRRQKNVIYRTYGQNLKNSNFRTTAFQIPFLNQRRRQFFYKKNIDIWESYINENEFWEISEPLYQLFSVNF